MTSDPAAGEGFGGTDGMPEKEKWQARAGYGRKRASAAVGFLHLFVIFGFSSSSIIIRKKASGC